MFFHHHARGARIIYKMWIPCYWLCWYCLNDMLVPYISQNLLEKIYFATVLTYLFIFYAVPQTHFNKLKEKRLGSSFELGRLCCIWAHLPLEGSRYPLKAWTHYQRAQKYRLLLLKCFLCVLFLCFPAVAVLWCFPTQKELVVAGRSWELPTELELKYVKCAGNL